MFDSAIYQTDYGIKLYTFVGSQVNLYYIDLSNQVFSFCCYGSDTMHCWPPQTLQSHWLTVPEWYMSLLLRMRPWLLWG